MKRLDFITILQPTFEKFKNMSVAEIETFMSNAKPEDVDPHFILFCGLLVGSGISYEELIRKLSAGDITEEDSLRAHNFGISNTEDSVEDLVEED